MATSPDNRPRWSAPANEWPQHRNKVLLAYTSATSSFLPGLLPEAAVALSTSETLALLEQRLGKRLELALSAENVAPSTPTAELPREIASPVIGQQNGHWLASANIVGVNIRTVGSLWNLVKYSFTLPAAQNAIHVLPIWEPGVVDSLYAPASWELNPEFFSEELAAAQPQLRTTANQLKAVINILHALGRTIGMDVIPHTDRYSEMSLGQPSYFEWLKRAGGTIVDHRSDLHEDVETAIFELVRTLGPANSGPSPSTSEQLFGDWPEIERRLCIFGNAEDWRGRRERRIAVVKHLHALGYEPAPATMAPPYRGLIVDPSPGARTTDANGLEWCDFTIQKPQAMSRVFGPLTRYKLYERIDDNANWEIDFTRPRPEVWSYICGKYETVQRQFGFDFMRGDMSHVQMRRDGVPEHTGTYYDILKAVKRRIHNSGSPHFAYFAESFLAPRNVMAYGDEVEHLEACDADATLGDLQSTSFGSDEFLQLIRKYFDIRASRQVAPSLTAMTADKDDPRFDAFYRDGNAARLFVGLFTGDMPSYMALGFECRDRHDRPAPNEHYTKLFVFHESTGPKATRGPYVWGRNVELFDDIVRMRLFLEALWPQIAGERTRWLIPPDPTLSERFFCWTQSPAAQWIFVVNTDSATPTPRFTIPRVSDDSSLCLELEFSTSAASPPEVIAPLEGPRGYAVSPLEPGEARAYRVIANSKPRVA